MRKTSKTKKEILVNAGHSESRVAIMEGGRLAEFHLEREPRIVSNIYKARVTSVLPGMEAAFVDIGADRHAFLSAEETIYEYREESEAEPLAPRPTQGKPLGGIAVGQEILVQVNRAAVAAKGARVTTRLALPGRYLVLLLTDSGRVGVSRRIESDKVRQRLRELGEELCPPEAGLILRTEAEGARKSQLQRDLNFLLELKKRLFEKAPTLPAPALVHQELSLIFQIIRDHFNWDVSRLLIDSEEVYRSALELVELAAPKLRERVALYKDEPGIFEDFGIEEDIARLWQRRVWLKAGGYISIDQSEALCAIDVNTARYTGKAKSGLAQTILKTNLEAAAEIARQLRLRDIGGLIVADFIDMKSAAHRAKVLKTFQEAVARDRAKSRILSISPLGIVEMTRKKHGESLLEKVSLVCPECGGLGRVPDPLMVCFQIQRELRRKARERPAGALVVWLSPSAAQLLIGPNGEQARQLASDLQRPLYVRARGENPRKYEVALLESGEVEERVGVFQPDQQLRCRRLGEEGDFALSEEGYLIELQPPAKTKAETITVELLKTDTYRGIGRVLTPAGEPEEVEEPKKRRGIRGRAYRRSRKKKEATPKEAVSAEKPAPPPAKPAEASAAPAEKKCSRSRRPRSRKRGTSSSHAKPAAEKTPPKSTASAPAQDTSQPKSGSKPRPRRRHPRRRRPTKSASENSSKE